MKISQSSPSVPTTPTSKNSPTSLNIPPSLVAGNGSESRLLSGSSTNVATPPSPVDKKNPSMTTLAPTKPPIKITSRIIFLKVGQIDTRNERYDAEAYIECTWEDDQIFKLLCDPNMSKNSESKR